MHFQVFPTAYHAHFQQGRACIPIAPNSYATIPDYDQNDQATVLATVVILTILTQKQLDS